MARVARVLHAVLIVAVLSLPLTRPLSPRANPALGLLRQKASSGYLGSPWPTSQSGKRWGFYDWLCLALPLDPSLEGTQGLLCPKIRIVSGISSQGLGDTEVPAEDHISWSPPAHLPGSAQTINLVQRDLPKDLQIRPVEHSAENPLQTAVVGVQ